MAIPKEEQARHALAVRDNFLKSVYLPKGALVSAYIPFNAELDPLPILDVLIERGYTTLIPFTPPNQMIIEFRLWTRKTPLQRTLYGLMEPVPDDSTPLIPDVIIMPLLAFDGKGHRLGYGAGYFDQTLGYLKKKTEFRTIGVAHQVQYYDEVPVETHDYPLDMCITEEKIYTFREQSSSGNLST
jgi:5-formyltetrahydrofolate cyclo-ligase